jgi:endonuclease YncB( thermonuclease family)
MRFIIAIILLLILSKTHASTSFYGKVIKVDGHQVLHVGVEGKLHFISLAYLMTPVRGEPYFEQSHAYLKDTIEGKWALFTIAGYGKKAHVRPALIRTEDDRSLNAALVKQGYSMVNLATQPPAVLTDMAMVASDNKVGLWALDIKLNPFDRKASSAPGTGISAFIQQKDSPFTPYVLINADKTARPIACGFIHAYDESALTKYVALNKGYKIIEKCLD